VIAPDANLLIYAYAPNDSHHAASRLWLETIFSQPEHIGIPIYSIYAFLRVVTNPKLARSSLSISQAAAIVDSWLVLPHVRILNPGDRHWILFQEVAVTARLQGAQLTDAAIAAIALEHDAVVHTKDRDFARFPNLRWINPLQP
jgi:toxin-antitoxin system PIN domain toxin